MSTFRRLLPGLDAAGVRHGGPDTGRSREPEPAHGRAVEGGHQSVEGKS
ncbi:MAG: hypothetical protein ACOY46_01585 [Bacillota bacterium]